MASHGTADARFSRCIPSINHHTLVTVSSTLPWLATILTCYSAPCKQALMASTVLCVCAGSGDSMSCSSGNCENRLNKGCCGNSYILYQCPIISREREMREGGRWREIGRRKGREWGRGSEGEGEGEGEREILTGIINSSVRQHFVHICVEHTV